MKPLARSFRLYFKDKFLLSATLLLFLYLVYRHVKEAMTLSGYRIMGDLSMLQCSLQNSVLCFAFFLFVSYAFLDKARHDSLEECARATRGGLLALYGPQIGALILLDFAFTALIAGFNLYACLVLGIGRAEVILHVLSCVLLYLFAAPLSAILLGALLAMKLGRLTACVVMVFTVLLTSDLTLYLVQAFYYSFEIDLFPVFEAICLFPRQTSGMPPHAVGYSLLPDRVSAALFYPVLLLIPLLLRLLRGKSAVKILSTSLCAALCLTCVGVYLSTGTKTLSDRNPRGDRLADQFYYDQTDLPPEQDGGFTITRYDMELRVRSLLFAKVTLYPDRADLPSYRFTLYHGYEISQITDSAGNALTFTRQGDSVQVTPPSDGLTALTFVYKGSNPLFYAHNQGIALPSAFAYYPRAGFRTLYDRNNLGFFDTTPDSPAEFSLKIDFGKRVYSNLPQTGENTFAGTADGCTLVAGFFDERTVDGISIVYPYLDSEQFGNGFLESDMKKFKDSLGNTAVRRIIILPCRGVGRHIECGYDSDGSVVCVQLRTLPDRFPAAIAGSKESA